jgi:hypothetical protein
MIPRSALRSAVVFLALSLLSYLARPYITQVVKKVI